MRAWSSAGGRELLSAGSTMHVEADAHQGLCVTSNDGPARSLTNVADVTLAGDVVTVRGDEGIVDFHAEAAGPLITLVPGSTRWRVRPVPEVLVWAKTFHRLGQACLRAVAGDFTVHIHLAANSSVAAEPVPLHG